MKSHFIKILTVLIFASPFSAHAIDSYTLVHIGNKNGNTGVFNVNNYEFLLGAITDIDDNGAAIGYAQLGSNRTTLAWDETNGIRGNGWTDTYGISLSDNGLIGMQKGRSNNVYDYIAYRINPSTIQGYGSTLSTGSVYLEMRGIGVNNNNSYFSYNWSDYKSRGYQNGVWFNYSGFARDINNNDTVVGTRYGNAYAHESGIPHYDLGKLNGTSSTATSINDNDVIVGYIVNQSDSKTAFVLDFQAAKNNGNTTDAMTLLNDFGYGSEAIDNNNDNQIIGTAVEVTGGNVPVIWNNENIVDINSRLKSSYSDWTILNVIAINNAGQILAKAVQNGVTAFVRLDPNNL